MHNPNFPWWLDFAWDHPILFLLAALALIGLAVWGVVALIRWLT